MLELRQLVKVYPGPVAALQGVDLSIPHGMFGLLGPNGAGKTTLMRILAGLLEPTSGQVFWGEQEVTSQPELVWPRLGYLPQSFGFYPNLTGQAMLSHLLRLKGVDSPKGLDHLCGELLERVNLSFAAKRKIKGYSGGMRQRLGIAQAIAGNPQLIIVDEPTAGLDPEERLRFYRLLAELAEERTVLLSTHIVEDVAVLCPRFAVIRRGQARCGDDPVTGSARPRRARLRRSGYGSRARDAAPRAASHAGIPGGRAQPRAALRTERTATHRLRVGTTDARRRVPRAHARRVASSRRAHRRA